MAVFRSFKMAAAAILDFKKNLTVGKVKRPKLCHSAKFRAAPLGRTAAEICRFFDFSKMAAVRHLGFVMRVFGPPTNDI